MREHDLKSVPVTDSKGVLVGIVTVSDLAQRYFQELGMQNLANMRVRYRDIIQATDSPYNTYLYAGLPPGPICSPGMKSIQAALNPADSKYMYFALEVETRTVRFLVNYNDFTAFTATQDYG